MWKKCCIFAHSWRCLIAFQLFNSLKLNHNNTPVGFCYSPSCKICISIFYSPHGIIAYTIACMAKHVIMISSVPSEILPPNFVDRSSNFCSSIIFCAFTDWKFHELEPPQNSPQYANASGWQVNGIPLMLIVHLLTEWHKASHSHKYQKVWLHKTTALKTLPDYVY